MKITYKIVSSNSLSELEVEVEKMLLDGYQLAGGVAISSDFKDEMFCQAVYKQSDSDKQREVWPQVQGLALE